MTTAFDTRMAAATLRLLTKFGVTATLLTTTPGAYAPAGGIRAPSVTVSTTLKVSPPLSLMEARSRSDSGGRVIGLTGGDVLPTDLYVIAGTTDTSGAAVPTPSAKQDRLTVAGVTYAIHRVWAVYSGDDVAAYEIQLRRS